MLSRWFTVALICIFHAGSFAQGEEKLSVPELVRRGSEQFLAGKVEQSIALFEQAVSSEPKLKPQLWQLGIAYYYAGRFAEGRELFELHQMVNSNDVENAAWHFICVAKQEGIENARKKLIPIMGDTRVPMKQLHALFAGGSREEVLKAAEKVDDAAERKNALCYAHLYLGLYEEAHCNEVKSLEHMKRAATDFRQNHYMGKVARVHANRRSENRP